MNTIEKETLQVSFPKEKLEALKFYMNEKDTSVEKELQEYIKTAYEKYVPAATRRYLDRNDSKAEFQPEKIVKADDIQQEAPDTTPLTRGRKRNTKDQNEEIKEINHTESVGATDENQEQVEEESQGMSMTM